MKRIALLFLISALFRSFGFGAEVKPALVLSPRQVELLRKVRKLEEVDPRRAERLLEAELGAERPLPLLFELAALKAKLGDYSEAGKLFEEITKRDPTFPGAQKNFARLLVRSGDYEKALDLFKEAFKREGVDPVSCRYLAQALVSKELYVQAEAALFQALCAYPSDPDLLVELARVQLALGKHASCEGTCRAALAVSPRHSSAWVLLARAYLERGDTGAAYDALEAAFRLGVELPAQALWTRADLAFKLGLYQDAVEGFKTAEKAKPPTAERLGRIARAFLAVGKLKEAEVYARRLLEEGGAGAEAWYVLGRIAERAGDDSAASAHFAEAVKADPLNGEAVLALARVEARLGKIEDALTWCRTAETLEGCRERALRCRLDILLGAERFKEALSVARELSRLAPSPPSWTELIAALRERIKAQALSGATSQ